jgi:hypothetical protein
MGRAATFVYRLLHRDVSRALLVAAAVLVEDQKLTATNEGNRVGCSRDGATGGRLSSYTQPYPCWRSPVVNRL